MRGLHVFAGLLLGVCLGCGGPPEAASAVTPPPMPQPEPEPELHSPEPDDAPVSEAKAPVPEPEFKDGMSVDEAINAVPQGSDRANIEQERLATPIAEMKLYEPCAVKPTQHVKIRIAIWDGRAVGVDVSETPKNPQLAECVKQQILSVTWRDKEKSLNTVEFAF